MRLEMDVWEIVQQLEAQRQQGPQAIIPLIEAYKRVLRHIQLDRDPILYATIQHNLGLAYSELQMGDYSINLTRAIECYKQALLVWTPETAPLDYAVAQYNLGNAYSDLPTGDRAANMSQAIACYQQAQRFLTPEIAPSLYAIRVSAKC